jgi:hypothetical protein
MQATAALVDPAEEYRRQAEISASGVGHSSAVNGFYNEQPSFSSLGLPHQEQASTVDPVQSFLCATRHVAADKVLDEDEAVECLRKHGFSVEKIARIIQTCTQKQLERDGTCSSSQQRPLSTQHACIRDESCDSIPCWSSPSVSCDSSASRPGHDAGACAEQPPLVHGSGSSKSPADDDSLSSSVTPVLGVAEATPSIPPPFPGYKRVYLHL